MKQTLSFIAAILVSAAPALAHPGHVEAATATHWVSDLSHLAVIGGLAALALIVLSAALVSRRATKRRKQE